MKWLFLLLFLSVPASAEQTKTTFNPFTGKLDYITVLSSNTLPAGSTQYIQNNPVDVQEATMTITGKAAFDKAKFAVYLSSPTAGNAGDVILAKDSSSDYLCFWTFVNGNRYRMCGCLDNPAGGVGSGLCLGLLCAITGP